MKKAYLTILLVLVPAVVFASGGDETGITSRMTHLVLQIGVIVFIARLGGILFEKIKFPSVVGELFVGILIGPYLLGGVSIPGFAGGLFPIASANFPISMELYGIAIIASVLLLFVVGLETDLSMFMRYSVAGITVGIGGVVTSFIIGDVTSAYFLKTTFFDPRCLFLGAMSTATSVGITARILSERKKIESPEGVTILAGAVIDDVLGIIILAVVLAIAAVEKGQSGGTIDWSHVHMITIKAIVVWLGFTALGLIFANKISKFLKLFKNIKVFSVLAFGMALIVAGIFEKAGLAMIIGAYVMGLAFSKTDLSYVIQETLHSIYEFMVPVFFTVMGMLVNVKAMTSKTIIAFGITYTLGAIVAKMVGCAVPPLFAGFNLRGSIRVGLGMIPRGEVALIIAGIGLANGILSNEIFGVAIIMTLITTIIAPPLLNASLRNPASGTKKEFKSADTVALTFDFNDSDTSSIMASKVLSYFDNEGFYIHMREIDCKVYSIRKDKIAITLFRRPKKITFEMPREDVGFVKTVIYEGLLDLYNAITKLQDIAKPEDMRRDVAESGGRTNFNIKKVLSKKCIVMNLIASTKDGVIKELIDVLSQCEKIKNKELVLKDALEREHSMSTGMEYGIAIPHGKTDGVSRISVAVGFKRDGIDFDSIDGKPSTIFFMILSPKNAAGPHIQLLACISSLLSQEECRQKLLSFKTADQVWNFLVENM